MYGNHNCLTNISSVVPAYVIARDWEIAQGRSFLSEEAQRAAKVAFVGNTVVGKLFEQRTPTPSAISP